MAKGRSARIARGGRQSLRDRRIAVNRSLDFYAAMSPRGENDAAPRNEIAGKRPRKKRNRAEETALSGMVQRALRAIPNAHLWRNNRGTAMQGERYITYGVGPNGASDYIGYRVVEITPQMVGKRIAQFCAMELKAPGKKLDVLQERFQNNVREDGGHADMIDSVSKLWPFISRE